MSVLRSLFLLILIAFPLHASEVRVHAAASLSDVLKEVAARYEKRSGDKLIFNFAASSTLSRQIREGAPGDVFFSADEAKMNDLQKEGLIVPATRRSILSNRLVIVVASDSRIRMSNARGLLSTEIRRFAIAEPSSVPAGIYARQYLERIGLWSRIQARAVPTENVRGALAAVESGNVEAGIVYVTDALISRIVRVACEIKGPDAPRISYPAAVLRDASDRVAAGKFVLFLSSREAMTIFRRHGFFAR